MHYLVLGFALSIMSAVNAVVVYNVYIAFTTKTLSKCLKNLDIKYDKLTTSGWLKRYFQSKIDISQYYIDGE